MKRLSYERIGDITLKIDLHNGYEIVAIVRYKDEKYSSTFYIKDKVVDDLMLMENKFENIIFNTNNKVICSAILKYVSENFESGNFNDYINRLDYYQKCFEVGNKYEEL